LPSEALKKQVLHYVQDDNIYDKNFRLRTLVRSIQLLNKIAELTLDIISFRLSSSHSAFSVFQTL